MFRNVAGQSVYLYAHNASGPVINEQANITVSVSKDGGARAAGAGAVTQLDAVHCPGVYLYAPTQAETDGAQVLFYGLCSTEGVQVDPVLEAGADELTMDEGRPVVLADELGAAAMGNVADAALAAIAAASPIAANVVQLNGGTEELIKLLASLGCMLHFTVVEGTLTASHFTTDLPAGDPDRFRNRVLIMRTGARANQGQRISASDTGPNTLLTVATPLTGAPAAGDTGIIV